MKLAASWKNLRSGGTASSGIRTSASAPSISSIHRSRALWSIVNGAAKLEYDLPLGLVGTRVRVEFTGPAEAGASAASLAGPAGTAECTLSSAGVSCHEVMQGLLPLTPDYAVIEQIAKAEYTGLASQRVDVAKQFASDPIGIVHVDLGAPVEEPHEDGADDD